MRGIRNGLGVMLLLLLIACNPQTQSSNSKQSGQNLTYNDIPYTGDTVVKVGLIFDRLRAVKDVVDAISGKPVNVAGSQYFLFGGGGTLNFLKKPMSVEEFTKAQVGFIRRTAEDIDQRNRTFLAQYAGQLTEQNYRSSPQVAAIAREGLVSVARVNVFGKASVETPMIWSIVLEGKPGVIDSVATAMGGTKFYKLESGNSMAVVKSPSYVQDAYAEFQSRFYNRAQTASALSVEEYQRLRELAKQRYGIDIGGTR